MSHSQAGLQFENHTPPVDGKILAITTESTTHAYDLFTIAFPMGKEHFGEAYVTLLAETNAAYISFGPETHEVDDGAVVTAGGTLDFTAKAGWLLPVGVPFRVRVSRAPNSPHRWLAVCTASTGGILRLYVSSPNNLG